MGMGSKSCNYDGKAISKRNSEDQHLQEKSPLMMSSYEGRNRLSLVGTAILERENLPLLTTTYHYWTDHAADFFQEKVDDFKSIELNKVAFGVNGFTERTSMNRRHGINDGSIYKSTSMVISRKRAKERESPCSHSDYVWAQKSEEKSQIRKFSVCNNFAVGFISCLLICTGYYYLVLL